LITTISHLRDPASTGFFRECPPTAAWVEVHLHPSTACCRGAIGWGSQGLKGQEIAVPARPTGTLNHFDREIAGAVRELQRDAHAEAKAHIRITVRVIRGEKVRGLRKTSTET
jgi:hypothetical protein